MPSPVRRSARAQPPPPPPKPAASSNHPSTSLHSSSKQDRGTKASTGPQKAATPHSLSSEDVSEPPRRSQRSQPKEEEMVEAAENVDEDAGDEEDITRCICGQQEYPGPPLSEAFSGVDAQGDDAGGLFIQCDGCSVWQHGGCVGIIEESQSPDKYYCEVCRPKLHDQHIDSRRYVAPSCIHDLQTRLACSPRPKAAVALHVKRRLQQALPCVTRASVRS